ncbi:MAG TPA: DJ-1/PfpI family protein [Gemmatimonadaceae bacterium]|nr:DJ-1/PfpI family protein [Gemmatimonadaceae bacterium]
MPQTIHLYVFDTLADWEHGYAVAGLNKPAMQRQPGRFVVRTVAESKAPIVTMGGVRIQPDLTLDQIRPNDSALLLLPGGDAWDEGRNLAVLELARTWVSANVPVAAICGGTAGLAKAGLLDTRRHTSNAPIYLDATGYAGGPYYEETRAVTSEDGLVITAGSMWPLEFAYEIFRRLGVYDAEVLAAWFGLFSTGEPQHFAKLMELAGEAATPGT